MVANFHESTVFSSSSMHYFSSFRTETSIENTFVIEGSYETNIYFSMFCCIDFVCSFYDRGLT